MKQAIAGYNTEQNRKRVFKKLLEDPDYMDANCTKVYNALLSGPKTGQEISKLIDMKEGSVFARLNQLRDMERVIDTGEKRKNPESNVGCTVWRIFLGQRKLF